jgi:aminoglycoside phosphotransferase (APT) family kinase protein
MGDERRHPFLELGYSAITELLHPVFPGCFVAAIDPLSGGQANTLYRVFVSGRENPVVLRIYTHDAQACLKEVALAQLVDQQVPVAAILYADATCQRVEYPYAVLDWVEGVQMDFVLQHGEPSDVHQAGYAAGATLAAIHQIGWQGYGLLDGSLAISLPFESPKQACKEYIAHCLVQGKAAERLGADLAAKLWSFVASHIDLLDDLPAGPCLTHGDYRPPNLMLARHAGPWHLAAVLDWEFAFAFTGLFDLGQLVRHDLALSPGFEMAAIAAYEAHGGALPERWKAMAKLLDLMNLCDFLDAPDSRPQLIDESLRLIQETIDRWPDYATGS